jgi:hypothetical protein
MVEYGMTTYWIKFLCEIIGVGFGVLVRHATCDIVGNVFFFEN